MAKYLDRISKAGFYGLDEIVNEADNDPNITTAQFYYIKQAAIERGTRLLFNRA